MPRIRTIKPEFWQDEKLSCLDTITRLVFLGLISMADDAGRLVDNVKSIDGFIFPQTADTAHAALMALAQLRRLIRYEAPNGQHIIQIAHWEKHQRVEHPNKYVLPAPHDDLMSAAGNLHATTSDQRPVPTTNDPSVSNETGNAAEFHDRRLTEHTLRSCIGLVVELLYFGNRPPEAAMRIEGSIAKQLGESHGYDRLARAIEGLNRRRAEGTLGNVGSRQAMSLKWLNSKKFDINQLAASEDAFYASAPEPRRGRGKATDIGDILASITPRTA